MFSWDWDLLSVAMHLTSMWRWYTFFLLPAQTSSNGPRGRILQTQFHWQLFMSTVMRMQCRCIHASKKGSADMCMHFANCLANYTSIHLSQCSLVLHTFCLYIASWSRASAQEVYQIHPHPPGKWVQNQPAANMQKSQWGSGNHPQDCDESSMSSLCEAAVACWCPWQCSRMTWTGIFDLLVKAIELLFHLPHHLLLVAIAHALPWTQPSLA